MVADSRCSSSALRSTVDDVEVGLLEGRLRDDALPVGRGAGELPIPAALTEVSAGSADGGLGAVGLLPQQLYSVLVDDVEVDYTR